jgi:tRNA pseudouridine55 synthase
MNNKAMGFILYNKPVGLTSFESLGAVKKAFATTKIGHTGTLDKFASGLLLVLVGRGVKLAPLFNNCTKEYIGKIFFGAETDTLDPEGGVIAKADIPPREKVEEVLDKFRGEILQAPPVFSAIHINGRRAHELSREGKIPEMKKRPVFIHQLELLSWEPPFAEIRALVSAGTYIRSLARDIALAAGSRAHLSALERTRLGPFNLDNAMDGNESTQENIKPIDVDFFNLFHFSVFHINDKKSFIQGKALEKIFTEKQLSFSSDEPMEAEAKEIKIAGVFDINPPNEFLGYLKQRNGKWVYGHVFADC